MNPSRLSFAPALAVSNAFRLGCELGLLIENCNETFVKECVSNAFRLGCELGPAVLRKAAPLTCRVSNAFRLGCELGLNEHKQTNKSKLWSPMPFGSGVS